MRFIVLLSHIGRRALCASLFPLSHKEEDTMRLIAPLSPKEEGGFYAPHT